jgi:hypothetical protein
MDQSTANPFLEDVFVDHPANLPGVGRIHHEVFSRVLESVESLLAEQPTPHSPGMGRVFLITAPEAGYGKSHLVARMRDHLGSIATTVVLPFDRSRPVAWPVALSSVLRQFSGTNRSRSHSVSLIEEVSRFFLSRLVLEAIESGVVKERECPEGSTRMRSDFASLFARDSDSKILAWVDKRSNDLARLANPAFSRNLGMGQSELGFWTRIFVDLNLREESALDRLRGLSNGEARERLVQLLRITTDYRPVMIVADGLDGFFASESAGMDITEIVNGIREKVPRSVTLVCLNEDVWSSVFENRLPSAWLDRLTAETAHLRSITPETAVDLVKIRLRRTSISEQAASQFALRLCDDHLWVDAATKLSPRTVLRQACELWNRKATAYLQKPVDDEDFATIVDEPLSNITDKADFFAPLQDDRPTTVTRVIPPALPAFQESPGSLPVPPLQQEPEPAHPFTDTPGRMRESELAGIDSIISDIRGSGKKVVSEAPEKRSGENKDPLPRSTPAVDLAPANGFTAPPTIPASTSASAPMPQFSKSNQASSAATPGFTGLSDFTASTRAAPAPEARTLTRASLEQMLARRENEFLNGPALTLDLERLERFIRTVGRQHVALGQQEERYPSSRFVCLRWNVRGQSVLTGFESPRNIYFWNNLLQQSLASNRHEKIAAFSHYSDLFDPGLFSSFGFSPAVIHARIDVIEMNDRELAMLYAADITLRELESTTEAERATQLITLRLDPLWRRIVQPV